MIKCIICMHMQLKITYALLSFKVFGTKFLAPPKTHVICLKL